ncbi:MAG TPA: hypothetical protein PKA24_14055 [Microthrixaceae bacterium]|nr:hypothetical protein [Microthrixaceae bacterium]
MEMDQDGVGDCIELFSDGHGLAVIGDIADVERFMAAFELVPRDEDGRDLARALCWGSSAVDVAADVAEQSGRWLKMTKESAAKVKALGGLTPTKTPGISHAMLGRPGASKSWIQVVHAPGTALTSPAALSGLGAIMSQMAMQQQLDAINDYLQRIDEKLDDLIRAQMNQVLARVDAVGLAIAEAMVVREAVGCVSDVAWSKVQNQPTAILETEAFALRQLADLERRFDRKGSVADMVTVCEEVEGEIIKYLSVLARCVMLHDAHAILELDRVMDASPEDVDRHRLGLDVARRERSALFERATVQVLGRLNEAADTANKKVLFNPKQTPQVVGARNHVAVEVGEFHEVLGIETGAELAEARRWREAVAEQVDRARDAGSGGIEGAKRLGSEARQQASSVRGRISIGFAERRQRQESDDSPRQS